MKEISNFRPLFNFKNLKIKRISHQLFVSHVDYYKTEDVEERLEREWFTIGRRSVTTMTEVTALIVTSMNRTSGRTDKTEAVIAVAFVSPFSFFFFSAGRSDKFRLKIIPSWSWRTIEISLWISSLANHNLSS